MSRSLLCLTIFAMAFMAAPVGADTLSGLADVTVVDGAIVSLRNAGAEYVVADGDLALGTTTRWYVVDGVETLWAEGDPAPEATVSGTSNPKEGDVGSKADNFLLTLDGSTNISSIDGIDFQETIFAAPSNTFFLFERGGNDAGSWQAILEDGSLGAEVTFDKASNGGPYADTGDASSGQGTYGVVFTTDDPAIGVRITASGHDTLSISTLAPPPPDMEIPLAAQPPLLDGEVDEMWAAASTQYFVPLDDPANASGSWQALYDSENLYVIVDITDDSLQNDSASSWQDDSVELYFDGGNTKLDTPLSGDDHQYTFGWTADDIQGTNITGATEGIEQAQVTTDTGWRIEIKMPWLSIQGAAPQAGDLIGIDCYYNDDDDGGDSREGKMLGFSAVEGWNDASQWGTAVLAAAEPVDPGVEGLVAYYAFENDANDSSGNGNDGTVVGTTTFVEGPAGLGMAMEFDGTSYVDCGNDASLDVPGPISIALWIKPGADDPEGQGTATAPLCKALSDASPSWSWQVRYGWNSPQPYMAFTFNTSPRAWAYVGKNLDRDEWVHIAGTHDGTTLKCYLNGAETDSTPMGAITSSPAPLLIGSDGWRDDWIGAIDDVAIYDRGLSVGEVRYLAGFRPPPAGPIGVWNLDEGAGDTAADSTGNGLDGAISGALWVSPGSNGEGSCLDFDGLGENLVDLGNFDVTTGDGLTIALWYKADNLDTPGNDPRMFSKAIGGSNEDHWFMLSSSRTGADKVLRFRLKTDGATGELKADAATGLIDLDVWTHVAAVWDGAAMKLYKNGVEVASVDKGGTLSTNPDANVAIGNQPVGTDARPWDGLIDDVRLYDRGLSAGEILELAGQ